MAAREHVHQLLAGGRLLAVDGQETIPGGQLPLRGTAGGHLVDYDLGRIAQVAQRRSLGLGLRVLEQLLVLLFDLLFGQPWRKNLVAGNQCATAGYPQAKRPVQRHLVDHRDGRHVEVSTGWVSLGPLDVHHCLARDLAQGVERGTRTKCDIGHRRQPTQQSEGHGETETDQQGPGAAAHGRTAYVPWVRVTCGP
jgi:hypothetical protein